MSMMDCLLFHKYTVKSSFVFLFKSWIKFSRWFMALNCFILLNFSTSLYFPSPNFLRTFYFSMLHIPKEFVYSLKYTFEGFRFNFRITVIVSWVYSWVPIHLGWPFRFKTIFNLKLNRTEMCKLFLTIETVKFPWKCGFLIPNTWKNWTFNGVKIIFVQFY